MKYNFIIKNINRYDATEFVQTWHYSKVMPKLTKHFLGIYNEDIMVGVLTLGWVHNHYTLLRNYFKIVLLLIINVNSKNVNPHKQGDSLYKFFE